MALFKRYLRIFTRSELTGAYLSIVLAQEETPRGVGERELTCRN